MAYPFDLFLKVDPNASKVRSKPWPHYDAWKMIFGKDRATGENAEDVMDVVNQLFNEQQNVEDYVHVEEQADLDLDEETQETSFTQSSHRGQHRTKRQKRSNTENNMQTMCELLGQIHRDTNERLESLGMRIGYKADLGKARKEVFDLIKEIPGLSLDNHLVVGEILAENEKRLEFFMGLPSAARATYVQKLIMEKEK